MSLNWFFAAAALAFLAMAAISPAADAGKGADNKGGKDAPKAQSGDKKSGKENAEQDASDAAGGLGAMGKMLPLGEENKNVKIPSFRDGKPSSFVRAGSMTRVDENHMDLKKMDIRLFGQTRADDLRVQLITGEYDMTTQILDSHQRSRISRDDFQLEGDSMVFDTKSQQGKMTGHVHMIIYDASALKKGPTAPAASGKEAAKDGKAEPASPAKTGTAKGEK